MQKAYMQITAFARVNFGNLKMKYIVIFFVFFFGHLAASDIVIELLVTDHNNVYWQTKNQMHMTIGHIKNVDAEKFKLALEIFNFNYTDLLQKNIEKGFAIEGFSTNGFGNGYHILEANPETTVRFALINQKLYDFLIENHFGHLTDKTTPKSIYPKGYTPHIEFLEKNLDLIPVKGDVLYFKENFLLYRTLGNN